MLSVQQRVEANNRARTHIQYIMNDIDFTDLNEEQQQSFWETLAREASCKCKMKLEVEKIDNTSTMNLEQAKKFEETLMPFGVYKGDKIGDIEYKYLLNLTEPNDFIKKLKSYIKFCEETRRK